MIIKKAKHVLKHTFIPHKDNDYKPHFFREHVVLTILIASITLLLLSFTSYIIIRTTTFGSSVVSSVLIDLTNQKRTEHGLPPLLYSRQLYTAAKMKGEDMVERQYFAHFAPDGTSPWHWFALSGYRFLFAGENLAINFRSSNDVQEAWMNSPKHRANILDKRFEDIGIATVPAESNGKTVLFVVQMFGKKQATSTPSSLISANSLPSIRFYEKLLFNTSYYINNVYTTLVGVLIIALMLMVFIEVRKQHVYHIAYGVLLIIITVVCIGINSFLL